MIVFALIFSFMTFTVAKDYGTKETKKDLITQAKDKYIECVVEKDSKDKCKDLKDTIKLIENYKLQ